jgi:prevent-host-death family protein
MSTWSISEAKAKFSEVVRRAQKEPQTITVRGVVKAEVISVQEYLRLGGKLPPAEKAGRKRSR